MGLDSSMLSSNDGFRPVSSVSQKGCQRRNFHIQNDLCVCMCKVSNYFRGHGDGGDDAASQP